MKLPFTITGVWPWWATGRTSWLSVAVMVALCACSNTEPQVSIPPRTVVDTKARVVCLGRLVPGERVIHVVAPAGAILKELRVKRADWVTKGQIIATLRDYDALRASLDHAKTEVAVAKAQLSQVKAGEKPAFIEAQQATVARYRAELQKARTDYERMKRLHAKQVVSLSVLEKAQATWESADQHVREAQEQLSGMEWVRPEDVDVAQKKLASAAAAHERAAAELELNVIRAPAYGKILEINAYPGETVDRRGIVDLADTRTMMVDAEIYISDIGRVAVGSVALVKAEGFSERLNGKVTEIIAQVMPNEVVSSDPLSLVDRRVVKARIRLDDGSRVASLVNTQVTVEIVP